MEHHMTEIPTLELKGGSAIPMIGYGTGSALMKPKEDNKISAERVEQIKAAIKVGFTHLDGAEAYNTERELGIAIKESGLPREKLFVTTKTLGFAPISQALDASLEKLQLDYVDLYLLHIPWIESYQPLGKAWEAMEAAKAAGKAKAIGVSNFLIPHITKILESCAAAPEVNQLEYSLYLQRAELHGFCRQHGIAVEGYAPLSPCTVASGGPADPLLKSLAKKYAVDEAAICMRWCLGNNVAIVTTTLQEERMRDSLRITKFQLTPQETEELSRVGAEKHFRKYFGDRFENGDRS